MFSTPKTIYLIRHTTPQVGKGICYGMSDVAVSSSFADEAAAIRQKLEGFIPQSVFSSPLQRCTLLANHLFADVAPLFDSRLVELDFGHWEMVPWDEIDSDTLGSWANGFWDTPAPGGESFAMLFGRVMEAWKELITASRHSDIAVVCHSGVMRVVMMALLDIPYAKIFNINLDYGAVVKVVWHDENVHKIQFL